jgi:membrane protein
MLGSMRTTARVERVRARALEIAPRAPGYEYALVAFSRDRRYGGGLLAGALAFRLFGALLPLALLLTVILGYAATADEQATESAADTTGISEALLQEVAQSSKLSTSTRWLVTLFAVFALLWAAGVAARAVRAVHSIAWQGRVGRFGRPAQAALLLLAALAACALVFGLAGKARAEWGFAGTLVTIATVFGFFAIWLGVEWLLPHEPAPWTALIPGAALFAVGVQVVHLGTALFIAGKIERASETYGSLGVAFTILFWLYIVSRVIVASAMLNAALWERRKALPATEAQPTAAEPQLT